MPRGMKVGRMIGSRGISGLDGLDSSAWGRIWDAYMCPEIGIRVRFYESHTLFGVSTDRRLSNA